MDIEFCAGCDGSISRRDADAGNVVRVAGRAYHRGCAPAPGGAARAWIPWLVLAPAVAAGVVAGVLLGSRPAASPGPAADPAEERLERRLGEIEGQVRGLSAQLEAVAGERREEEAAGARALRAHEEALRRLDADLDRIVDALSDLAHALTRPPAPAPAEGAPPAVALPDLVRRSRSGDFGDRFSALHALSLRPEPEALAALRSVLADENRLLRAYAARLLGERGDASSAGELVALLRDDDALVRQAAHRALLLVSGMPFPFDPLAPEEERAAQAASWEKWWAEREASGTNEDD